MVEGAALARGDDPGLDKDLERVMSAAGAARQNEDAQASAGPPAAATGEAVGTSAGAGPAQEGH